MRLNAILLLFHTLGKITPCEFIENVFYEHFYKNGEDGINDFIDRICRLSFVLKTPDAADYRRRLIEQYESMDMTGERGLVNMCDSKYNLTLLFVD